MFRLFKTSILFFLLINIFSFQFFVSAQSKNETLNQRSSTWTADDLEKMQKVLADYSNPLSNVFLNNDEGLPLHGSVVTGIIWLATYVNSSNHLAFSLSARNETPQSNKGDLTLSIDRLSWDEEEQQFVGVGVQYGRGFKHCSNTSMSATIKVRPYQLQPFQGAFADAEVTYDSLSIDEDCNVVSRKTRVVNFTRTFTHVETIVANDYTLRKFAMVSATILSEVAKVRARILEAQSFFTGPFKNEKERVDAQKDYDYYRDRLKEVDDFVAHFNYFDRQIKSLDSVLRAGGTYDFANYGDPANEQKFARQSGLDSQNSSLLGVVRDARLQVLSYENWANKLAKEITPSYERSVADLRKAKADRDAAEEKMRLEKEKAEKEARDKAAEEKKMESEKNIPSQNPLEVTPAKPAPAGELNPSLPQPVAPSVKTLKVPIKKMVPFKRKPRFPAPKPEKVEEK